MLYLGKQAIVTQQVITLKNNFSHPIWHIFSRIWCNSGAKPFIFNIMLQIANLSRIFLNAALFISLEYPVNAIFQLPFKSNSEVLDSPPLFLCTINYVSYWVSVSTRPFPVYFLLHYVLGNSNIKVCISTYTKLTPSISAQFQRRYSRCEIILIHFHVNLRKIKSLIEM